MEGIFSSLIAVAEEIRKTDFADVELYYIGRRVRLMENFESGYPGL